MIAFNDRGASSHRFDQFAPLPDFSRQIIIRECALDHLIGCEILNLVAAPCSGLLF